MILGGKKSTTQKGEASSDAAAVALKLIIPKLFLNSFMTSSTHPHQTIWTKQINESLLIIKNTLINKLKKRTIYFAIHNGKDILMR